MRARDLFAGSGWGVACRALGIEDHGVEWNEHARETRRINGLVTVGRDVRDVNGADGEYVLEIGSPPCERFTSSGHGDGHRARAEIVETVLGMNEPGDIYAAIKSLDTHHEKVALVLEPLRVLLENPYARAAVWEQVREVLPIWEAVAVKLRAWGWSVDTRVVSAAWYGVPQDRKRAILLARRDGDAVIPGETTWRVMADVFPSRVGWVQRSNNSGGSSHQRRTPEEKAVRTMRRIDQLSVTMTSKGFKWILPDGSMRTASVADMATIQTFPAGMEFAGGISDQRLQVGNAVPPLMAEALIRAALGLTLTSHDGKVDPNSKNDGGEADMTSTDTETQTARELTGSAVVKLLERVHERIRQNHPEVPEVVIVTGAGIGFGGGKWGHFRPQGWTTRTEEGDATHVHEMFMAGETLAKGGRQVLQTMLHESAHALAEHRGEKDTSRQGRWHNQVFRKTAQELGLEYKGEKADKTLGFSQVTLTAGTVEEYRDLLEALDAEIYLMVRLPGWLGGTAGSDEDDEDNGGENMGKAPKTGTASTSNNVKLTCKCEEPNIIRASKKVAAKMVVNCGDCDALFLERS